MVGLKQEYNNLSNDGFRVLAVATKDLPGKNLCSKDDERELVLRGYVAFLDPPKNTAVRAIEALHKHGVEVKILTVDNHLISRKVCKDVGLSAAPCCWAATWRKCPTLNWPILMLTLFAYMGLMQTIKVWLLRKKWI